VAIPAGAVGDRDRLGAVLVVEMMGSMYGSCGHDITAEWDAWFESWYKDASSNIPDPDPLSLELATMSYSREGERAVLYGTYCKACRVERETWGIVLHNEQEQEAWMRGKLEYPE
jgi:hypothetical protein